MAPNDDVLSRAEVARIAELARLALTPDEVDLFARQLGDILAYAREIQAIDTSDVAPTAHALVPDQAWRADRLTPSLDADAVLQNAPDATRDPLLFRVPKVIG